MRWVRLLALLAVLTLTLVAASNAGPGTAVFRGNFPAVWFWWNDYEVTNVAFTSSDPQFYVDGFCYGEWPPGPAPEWKLFSYHDLFYIASGKENYWIKGPVFTRVYGGFSTHLDPSGFPWATDAWACDVLQGREGHLLADGISQFNWNDINTCKVGPGRNTWDMRAVGNLSAPLAVCPSGMTHFEFTFHYMLTKDAVVLPGCTGIDDPAHIRSVVIRGPDLKCIGMK